MALREACQVVVQAKDVRKDAHNTSMTSAKDELKRLILALYSLIK